MLKALKQSEKTEYDISRILLTFSCLVPTLSVLEIYNKQRSKCLNFLTVAYLPYFNSEAVINLKRYLPAPTEPASLETNS